MTSDHGEQRRGVRPSHDDRMLRDAPRFTGGDEQMAMPPCLTPDEFLSYALQASTEIGVKDAARHLGECAVCRAGVARAQESVSALRATAGTGAAPGPCIDELTVAVLAEGRATPGEQRAAAAHLATCARCRRDLTGLQRLMVDPRIAHEVDGLTQRAPSRRWRISGGVGLGVAAVLVVMLVRVQSGPHTRGEDRRRDETTIAEAGPRLLTPVGPVGEAGVLRWTTVSRADNYRVTLFDAEGRVLWETEIADTTVAIPATVQLAQHVRLVWRVAARTGFDRWVSSPLKPFVITGRAP
jgi:hypothetical protein